MRLMVMPGRGDGGGRGGGGGGGGGDGGAPEGEGAVVALEAVVDGRVVTLGDDDWMAVDVLSVRGDEGRGERDAIPLRALAERAGGKGAAVTEVVGADGTSVAIPAEAWADAARIPVLRLNRRGLFKFHWMGADLVPLPGEQVRRVVRLVIRTTTGG